MRKKIVNCSNCVYSRLQNDDHSGIMWCNRPNTKGPHTQYHCSWHTPKDLPELDRILFFEQARYGTNL